MTESETTAWTGGTVNLEWARTGRRGRHRYAWHLTVTTDEGARFTMMGESSHPPSLTGLMHRWADQHDLGPITLHI